MLLPKVLRRPDENSVVFSALNTDPGKKIKNVTVGHSLPTCDYVSQSVIWPALSLSLPNRLVKGNK